MTNRVTYRWAIASVTSRSIIAVYAVCFLVGAASHVVDLLGGWPPYAGYPVPLRLFWTALLPIDVALAWVLFSRTVPAVVISALVMLLDVVANAYAIYYLWETDFARSPGLWRQCAFLVFILCTAPLLLREANVLAQARAGHGDQQVEA